MTAWQRLRRALVRAEDRARVAEERAAEAERQQEFLGEIAARAIEKLSDEDLLTLHEEIAKGGDDSSGDTH